MLKYEGCLIQLLYNKTVLFHCIKILRKIRYVDWLYVFINLCKRGLNTILDVMWNLFNFKMVIIG